MTREETRDWNAELQEIHHRLEATLEAARVSVSRGRRGEVSGQDLRMPCFAFCSALSKHHEGEDAGLFPRLANDQPELRPVIDELMAAHLVITEHLTDLRRVLDDETSTTSEILGRLHATKVFMKTHFGDEERRLAGALHELQEAAPPSQLLGSVPPLGSD